MATPSKIPGDKLAQQVSLIENSDAMVPYLKQNANEDGRLNRLFG